MTRGFVNRIVASFWHRCMRAVPLSDSSMHTLVRTMAHLPLARRQSARGLPKACPISSMLAPWQVVLRRGKTKYTLAILVCARRKPSLSSPLSLFMSEALAEAVATSSLPMDPAP